MDNNRFKFRYAAREYTPSRAKLLSDKGLRDEYTRMRNAVQKRLNRLSGTEWAEIDDNKEFQAPIKKLSEIKDKTELVLEFNRAFRFLRRSTTTLSGFKKEQDWFFENFGNEDSSLSAFGIADRRDYVTWRNLMTRLSEASAGVRFDSPRIKKFFEEHASDEGKSERGYREKLIKEFFDKYVGD